MNSIDLKKEVVFYNIVNVFAVTIDQLHESLQNKIIYFKKILLTSKFWMVV